MNILTYEEFDEELIPNLAKWCRIPATLQRKCGLKAFETGLRRQKGRGDRVKIVDYDKTERTITIIGFNGRKRKVPIHNDLDMEEVLAFYTKGNDLFRLLYGMKKVPSYTSYYSQLRKAFEKMGHEPWVPQKKSTSKSKNKKSRTNKSECLRAYFILDWLLEGTSLIELEELRELVGLESIEQLQSYIDAVGLGESRIKHFFDRL